MMEITQDLAITVRAVLLGSSRVEMDLESKVPGGYEAYGTATKFGTLP